MSDVADVWAEWVEAGARALFGPEEEGPSLNAEQLREGCRSLAEQVLEAVEPRIRAAVTAETLDFCCDDTRPAIERDLRARIVAAVTQLGHALDCEAFAPLYDGNPSDPRGRMTGKPCDCLLGEVLAAIEAT